MLIRTLALMLALAFLVACDDRPVGEGAPTSAPGGFVVALDAEALGGVRPEAMEALANELLRMAGGGEATLLSTSQPCLHLRNVTDTGAQAVAAHEAVISVSAVPVRPDSRGPAINVFAVDPEVKTCWFAHSQRAPAGVPE